MQSFMNGSECSTGANPLAQLLKQQGTDNSMHHSQFQQQGSSSASMRSHPGQPGLQHEEAERFFQQQQQQGGGGGSQFAMEGLRRELESVARGEQKGPIIGDREWASQYHPASSSLSPAEAAHLEDQFRQSRSNEFSAEYFRQQQQASPAGPSFSAAGPAAASQRPAFAPAYGAYGSSMGMGGMGGMGMMGGGMMNGGQMFGVQGPAAAEVVGKGKARFVELDDATWEAQFARVGEAATTEDPAASTATAGEQPATMNLLDGDSVIDASAEDAKLLAELEDTWSNLQSTLTQSSVSDAEMAAWEAQYGSQFADINGDGGLDENMLNSTNPAKAWTRDNVDAFLQNEQAYPFAPENTYMGHPDPYAEGQRLLAEGAPLSEAALAFEAACRIDETRGEAWRAAGETWAADEREVKGIRALEKAVACGGPDGIAAWMSLAVAYVNEGQELRALATLERWLSLAYPSISVPPASASAGPWDASNRVIDLFLGAARAGPDARVQGQSSELANVDPDVQVGLGVLFYSNSDYERAKDCFEAALSDFLLWNRLGATLANGGMPEDAISAYRKALDLRPTFTRATYNLGVSCLNIGCYHEAAEHLLAAIEGQMTRDTSPPGTREEAKDPAKDADDEGSANLWHTLRRSFLCMDRHDLAEMAKPGTDVGEFRAHGFEF
ncbi:hypothetical protein RQP46_003816 [Phenoliferia psychrophenolica]